jgi:CheY-like chemotaxis protein
MGTVAMIEELGHDAIEASGGAEALAILARRPEIDLVVTDHAMPGMTGVELARRLREVAPALPVVLATGYAELPGGADLGLPRLAKPFRQQELGAAIAAAVAGGPAASGAS